MQAHPLHHRGGSPQAVPANGAAAEPVTPGSAAGRTAFRSPVGTLAQLAAMAGMLTGLWVAISPWFLTLQVPRGGNATANDLIIGLAIAGLGLLTITGARSLEGLQPASLLAGVWLIISPFILDATVPVTAAMYWSNIWSGAIVIVAALAVLGLGKSRAARLTPPARAAPFPPAGPARAFPPARLSGPRGHGGSALATPHASGCQLAGRHRAVRGCIS